jgi:hypothetical protein
LSVEPVSTITISETKPATLRSIPRIEWDSFLTIAQSEISEGVAVVGVLSLLMMLLWYY